MPARMPPGLKMITDGSSVHAVRFGGDSELDELARRELFSRCFVPEFQFSHQFFLLLCERSRPATPGYAALASTLAGMAELVQVTDKVHLAHGHAVNWVLVADNTGVMLIDAGYPGDREAVLASLGALGYRPGDVRAILLTHAHIDHLGTAIWLANEYGTPVYCHADEVGHARREYRENASILDVVLRSWRPRTAVWGIHVLRSGGLIRSGIPTAQPLTAEAAATLPGQPMAIFTPGHTSGHCSYLVDRVLASGDALITGHPMSRHRGPQLLPRVFNHHQQDTFRSLDALALLETEMLAPGHGDLWRGPIREATDAALNRASRRKARSTRGSSRW